jgi:hypothetical protein
MEPIRAKKTETKTKIKKKEESKDNKKLNKKGEKVIKIWNTKRQKCE